MATGKVELYEEMATLLRKAGTPLSTDHLASKVKFRTKQGNPPSTYQIASNAYNHPELFEVMIQLKK